MMNRNCFAFTRVNGKPTCMALKEMCCLDGEKCLFYKPKAGAPKEPQGNRAEGKTLPRTDITREKIEKMLAKGMSIKVIAEELNCSQTTLHRRLSDAATKWGGRR